MDGATLGLLEGLLVFGGVLGFGVWQLVSVRRSLARDRRRQAAATAHDDRDPEPRAPPGPPP
ncbi:hypothetical protein C1M51_03605 [Methylibium sp. Pch-M]|uniref:hypothetical protein n=1 Tax=Methylibium sp. Pch-M TaxID=2082386 RepID=UPI0010124C56|nr:hypothetical protein [Methylibium sp. Pch-M]QAZ41350.1 hypothetical protein C1M51_03605 [Methylibium sp. Pch-M]